MKKELTCIACPLGCNLVVTMEEKNVLNVTGNTCPRGKEYAITECTSPKRTVTTTVLCENGVLSECVDRGGKAFLCVCSTQSKQRREDKNGGDNRGENFKQTGFFHYKYSFLFVLK